VKLLASICFTKVFLANTLPGDFCYTLDDAFESLDVTYLLIRKLDYLVAHLFEGIHARGLATSSRDQRDRILQDTQVRADAPGSKYPHNISIVARLSERDAIGEPHGS